TAAHVPGYTHALFYSFMKPTQYNHHSIKINGWPKSSYLLPFIAFSYLKSTGMQAQTQTHTHTHTHTHLLLDSFGGLIIGQAETQCLLLELVQFGKPAFTMLSQSFYEKM